ncbi:metallophosphatase family protein [Halobacillus salinarum]|uniref:Phosphoesterase n=1 Tax=Halobacillus salinarum TaxID=2932257 RepID=A0ABY4EMB4_9BACI|nr:metallophosphoesterase family protein [Halobacillus salinarum]UOQ44747.1 metallophosphatase family protein [Halobacillus salinarum]
MKIVVIADTHFKKEVKLPQPLINALQKADLIIHAGDWKTPALYEELKQYAPVEGVYGNIDEEDIQALFPDKQVLDIKGHTIGLVHGHGEKKTTEKRVVEAFQDEAVDLIIFGHSHLPLLRFVGKRLLFNPGSPTDKRRMPYYSFGVLTIDEELTASHHFFPSKK